MKPAIPQRKEKQYLKSCQIKGTRGTSHAASDIIAVKIIILRISFSFCSIAEKMRARRQWVNERVLIGEICAGFAACKAG